ncbi:MAG TPA: cytochrome c [Planctomycetota bacterium]|nr:cytochrome c [Planctomycetota bacterium]
MNAKKTSLTKAALLGLAASIAGLSGCMRGGISSEPPVHLVLDMDFQPKLRAQSEASFAGWSDKRGMRVPVADSFDKTLVVARGSLPEPALANRDAKDAFVTSNPVRLDRKFTHLGRQQTVLERGQERFNIYCAVCHGYSGQGGNDKKQGHGLVGRRWPAPIPNFHFQPGEGKDNRVPLMPDGEFFEVITFGKGTMPAYGARISPEDRWCIVHYVRALQKLSK